MFERKTSCPANTKHLYNIYTTSAKRLRRWSNIANTNVLCLLGVNTSLGSIIQSVCLQANEQVGVRAKGFELLTHRCCSIYELILELALNEALGMKHLLLWNKALAYPRAQLHCGGPLSCEF